MSIKFDYSILIVLQFIKSTNPILDLYIWVLFNKMSNRVFKYLRYYPYFKKYIDYYYWSKLTLKNKKSIENEF